MRAWDFQMDQVVVVDRRLLVINAEVVKVILLLQQRAGGRYPPGVCRRIYLSPNEVLFFKSEPATLASPAVVS